jgi:hypothetical protein
MKPLHTLCVQLTIVCTSFMFLGTCHQALSKDLFKIEVVTDIRNVSVFSFEVGEKSRQIVALDYSSSKANSKFDTGHTSIAGFDFDSIRNDFKISGVKFDGNIAGFKVTGQTASRIGILPDIDYSFDFKINKNQSKIWISGCHNEYPSYRILVDDQQVYDREQTGTVVFGLLGKCDILVSEEGKSF